MAFVIGAFLAIQMTLIVFKIDPNLLPGLSTKNAMLYAMISLITLQVTLNRSTRFELRGIQYAYVALVLYALITWAIAWTIIDYPNYPVGENGFAVKSLLLDFFLVFITCFYGLRTMRDVVTSLRVWMVVTAIANLVCLTEITGITSFGIIEIGEGGRVAGPLGEANQYAAFLALCIPLYAAAIFTHRGLWRLGWLASLIIALIAMLTTVSRGGFVAVIAGALIGSWIFRRQLPMRKTLGRGAVAAAIAVVLLFAFSAELRSLIIDRLFSESRQADMSNSTSGRSDIWYTAIQLMMDHPITFLTGYGWRVYWSMPVEYSPHNTYLNYWFNLGLPGLFCLITTQLIPIRVAIRAAFDAVDGEVRAYLIAFVFGVIGLSIGIFFVELYAPWAFVWALYGIVMRMALLAAKPHEERVTQSKTRRNAVRMEPRDPQFLMSPRDNTLP